MALSTFFLIFESAKSHTDRDLVNVRWGCWSTGVRFSGQKLLYRYRQYEPYFCSWETFLGAFLSIQLIVWIWLRVNVYRFSNHFSVQSPIFSYDIINYRQVIVGSGDVWTTHAFFVSDFITTLLNRLCRSYARGRVITAFPYILAKNVSRWFSELY